MSQANTVEQTLTEVAYRYIFDFDEYCISPPRHHNRLLCEAGDPISGEPIRLDAMPDQLRETCALKQVFCVVDGSLEFICLASNLATGAETFIIINLLSLSTRIKSPHPGSGPSLAGKGNKLAQIGPNIFKFRCVYLGFQEPTFFPLFHSGKML